jgi:hypothetical protein
MVPISFGKQIRPARIAPIQLRENAGRRLHVLLHNNQWRKHMASATQHPHHQLISSEDVQGTTVYGVGDEKVGEIDHLIIDKLSGRVIYAVMSFGGFLGLGHSHYPVPWAALKYDTALEGFRTGITEQQLKDAPEFSDDAWGDRNWETVTHRHYGVKPYWDASARL